MNEHAKFFEKEHSGKVLKCWKTESRSVLFVFEEYPEKTMGTVCMTYAEVSTLIELLQEAIT